MCEAEALQAHQAAETVYLLQRVAGQVQRPACTHARGSGCACCSRSPGTLRSIKAGVRMTRRQRVHTVHGSACAAQARPVSLNSLNAADSGALEVCESMECITDRRQGVGRRVELCQGRQAVQAAQRRELIAVQA